MKTVMIIFITKEVNSQIVNYDTQVERPDGKIVFYLEGDIVCSINESDTVIIEQMKLPTDVEMSIKNHSKKIFDQSIELAAIRLRMQKIEKAISESWFVNY